MTEKELRGLEVLYSLPMEFNIFQFLKQDGSGIDYEMLADWDAARKERNKDKSPS